MFTLPSNMNNTIKQLENLQRQNDGIYKSLTSKGVEFSRVQLDDSDSDDIKLQKLSDENTELKKLAAAHKPPPVQKEPKQKNVQQPKKPKNDENDDDDDDETYEDKKKVFTPITNLEPIKMSFFGGEFDEFVNQVKQHELLFYRVLYKYNSDKDGVPDFNAKNLVKGLVKPFEDQKKFFMNCFRCYKTPGTSETPTYEYKAWFIVNTKDSLNEVVGHIIDDFDLLVVDQSNLDKFFEEMKKTTLDENGDFTNSCISEIYVH